MKTTAVLHVHSETKLRMPKCLCMNGKLVISPVAWNTQGITPYSSARGFLTTRLQQCEACMNACGFTLTLSLITNTNHYGTTRNWSLSRGPCASCTPLDIHQAHVLLCAKLIAP